MEGPDLSAARHGLSSPSQSRCSRSDFALYLGSRPVFGFEAGYEKLPRAYQVRATNRSAWMRHAPLFPKTPSWATSPIWSRVFSGLVDFQHLALCARAADAQAGHKRDAGVG